MRDYEMRAFNNANPAPTVQPVGNPMIPFAPEFQEPSMEQRILQSVMGEQAIKNAKAPKVTQEQAKRKIASMEGDSVNMQMSAPVPQTMMNMFQKEEDKTHQQIVREYMKKREALAKNAEDRARIMGDNFKSQTNLAPLMQLSDMWFGGNLAQSYKAPETLEQNMTAQQRFDSQAANQYGSLTDDEMNLLRQKLVKDQYDQNNEIKKQKMLMESKGGFKNLGFKEQQKIRESFAKSDDYQTTARIGDYKNALSKYKSLVSKFGAGKLTGSGRKVLENAHADLIIKFKEAAKLGALAGPDMGIAHQTIAPATGVGSMFSSAFTGGTKGIVDQITSLEQAVDGEAIARMEALKQQFPEGVEKQYETLKKHVGINKPRAISTNNKYSNESAKTWLANNPNHPKAAAVRAKLGM